MPDTWKIYGVGGQLGCVASLLESCQQADQDAPRLFTKLQHTLSAVAVRPLGQSAQPSPDSKFIAELALGLLARGQPTLSSPHIEEQLLACVPGSTELRVEPEPDTTGYRLRSSGPAMPWIERFLSALMPVDTRLEPAPDLPLQGREPELFPVLKSNLGNAWGWLEPQRPLRSMVSEVKAESFLDRIDKAPRTTANEFQRVDFALETSLGTKLTIELDGSQHQHPTQQLHDEKRDNLLKQYGWEIKRIPTSALPNPPGFPELLNGIVSADPLLAKVCAFTEPDPSDPHVQIATRLTLAPHAVSRAQLGVLLGILHGHLKLDDDHWHITIIERETPCALLAVHDLADLLGHLCGLYDIAFRPIIKLTIFTHHQTEPPAFATDLDDPVIGHRIRPEFRAPDQLVADPGQLVIDVAVRARWTQTYADDPFAAMPAWAVKGYIIRTAHRLEGEERFTWSAPRVIHDPRSKIEHLEYFLRLLFRKPAFREGQIDIIERALRRESVIGLLPTGAGKSLTFQLPALLSPGLTVVVAPIKSLMQDQVDNLALAQIDRALMINSDQSPEERERATHAMTRGSHRLVYISPERFQIEGFRDALKATGKHTPFSFVAVDEAHCVSEWGHDFRTAYLNLGRHAREFCKASGEEPPLLALTATASRPVLIDVQRELGITAPDAIISASDFDRRNLRFEILKAPPADKATQLVNRLRQLIQEFELTPEAFFDGTAGGIIFCPHVDGHLGVWGVCEHLRKKFAPYLQKPDSPLPGLDVLPGSRIHIFAGKQPKNFPAGEEEWSTYKRCVQRLFKTNEIPLIVATSSFGMGIDKPNIRYTVHYAMTQTVESFVQEAGRAGRDGQPASCTIIFSNHEFPPEQDPLAEGISSEEAQKRRKAAEDSNRKDDTISALFLFQQGFAGLRSEISDIRQFYNTRILAKWKQSGLKDGERQKIVVQGTREKNEKIVYRLSLLGIVEDYTIDHNRQTFTLMTRRATPHEIFEHLYAYIRRYRREDVVAMVKARLDGDEGSDPVYRAIAALCTFVYDEIEKTRRMAIRNMREILRKSKDGEDFRAAINNYLAFNIFTREVADLLRSSSDADWWKIADKVMSSNDAVQLLGQVRRQRESDAEHPGLLVLQGLATAAIPDPRPDDAANLLMLGLLNYARSPLHDDCDVKRVGRESMARLATLAPQALPKVAHSVTSRYQRTREDPERRALESLVRGAYPWIHKYAADTDLDRAAAVPALQDIAESVRHLVNTHLETDA